MDNNNGTKEKKGFRLGGFFITYKTLIIIGVIVAVIVIMSRVSSARKAAEIERRNQAAMQQQTTAYTPQETLSYDDQMQQAYIKSYGTPPEGYKWDSSGNLIPLYNTEDMNYEDVMYAYIRACSILDFSTAGKYARNGRLISTFEGYFLNNDSDYYSSFLAKQYRFALTTLEVEGIKSTAVMADGTYVLEVTVSCLDLQNKDFWQADKDEIFDEMYYYSTVEHDGVKSNEYLYNYLYQAYEDGKVGKRSYDLNITLEKVAGGGWYVSDDNAVRDVLMYENGNDVVSYIRELYQDYVSDKQRG